MLELQISNIDASSGAIAVSWCVSKNVLQYLADRQITDPQLIIVISPSESNPRSSPFKELRKVVPLKDLVAYLELPCPGENNIWAMISTCHNRRSSRRYYLERSHNLYYNDLITPDGADWAENIRAMVAEWKEEVPNMLFGPLPVDVPQECFAPEPPEWEKAWVNHFFLNLSPDQCHYRRRRLFAYSIQPLIMLGNLFLRFLLVLFACLVGARNLSLRYLLHPLTYGLSAAVGVCGGGSYFVEAEKFHTENGITKAYRKYESELKNFLWEIRRLPLMPLVWLPFVICAYFHVLHILLLAIGVLIVFLILVVCVVWLTSEGFERIWDKLLTSKTLWYLRDDEAKLLTCDTNQDPKSLSDLPAKHRTIKLRYYDLKSKVCKPFMR